MPVSASGAREVPDWCPMLRRKSPIPPHSFTSTLPPDFAIFRARRPGAGTRPIDYSQWGSIPARSFEQLFGIPPISATEIDFGSFSVDVSERPNVQRVV